MEGTPWQVDVLEYYNTCARSTRDEIPVPAVIRVRVYVSTKPSMALSRRNILIRDKFICQYCGCCCRNAPTIDHVIPASKGGPRTWDNLVACCAKCNLKKADKMLKVRSWTRGLAPVGGRCPPLSVSCVQPPRLPLTTNTIASQQRPSPQDTKFKLLRKPTKPSPAALLFADPEPRVKPSGAVGRSAPEEWRPYVPALQLEQRKLQAQALEQHRQENAEATPEGFDMDVGGAVSR